MAELYTLFATVIGVPLVLIGWIWCMAVAKKHSMKWFLAVLFLSVFALPAYALLNWARSKGPFVVTSIGVLLLLGILPVLP